jgi:alpha-L-rhamnosidase
MAITWGMLTGEQETTAGDRLADLVRLSGFRISTGFVGTPIITDALSMTGHADVAYRLLQEKRVPSWLYPVTMGATTIWERWDSMLPDGTINPGDMTSFNHYALGAVADWMHRVVAGLAFDPIARTVTIAPVVGGTLDHASTALATPYGRAESGWRRDGMTVVVEALVPAGLVGHVTLPDGTTCEIESGRHSWTVDSSPTDQRPETIRGVIGSPWWDQIVEAIVARTPIPGELAITGSLKKMLDAPIGALGGAVTLGGMMGPADEIQAAINEILARG